MEMYHCYGMFYIYTSLFIVSESESIFKVFYATYMNVIKKVNITLTLCIKETQT